jgi:hypothetical protein
MADRNSVAAAISTTCRRVLIDSPVASRYALERFRTLIDPELANKMEIVGSYTCKVQGCLSPYLQSSRSIRIEFQSNFALRENFDD